jgi:hypothetical protein
MANRKPTEDETIRVPSGPVDSFSRGQAAREAGPRPSGPTAPEASQGAWRERAFTPRAAMSLAEIVETLERALRVLMTSASHPRVAFDGIRQAWLPALRQAVEQLGGDGLDAWLGVLLAPPGRSASNGFFSDLVAALHRMRGARDVAHLEEEALKAIELVRRVGRSGLARGLSFKVLELRLEGKLELDELILVATASDEELRRRLSEIGGTMERLRDQLTNRPGQQPEGMYSNFVRLKAELRVVDAELNRRSLVQGDPTPVA